MCPQRGKMGGVSFTKKKGELSLWARLFVVECNTANLYFLSYSILLVIPLEICEMCGSPIVLFLFKLCTKISLVFAETSHSHPWFIYRIHRWNCRRQIMAWEMWPPGRSETVDTKWQDRAHRVRGVRHGVLEVCCIHELKAHLPFLPALDCVLSVCAPMQYPLATHSFLPRDKNNKSLDRIWHTFSQLYDPWSRKRWPSIADLMWTLFFIWQHGLRGVQHQCNRTGFRGAPRIPPGIQSRFRMPTYLRYRVSVRNIPLHVFRVSSTLLKMLEM